MVYLDRETLELKQTQNKNEELREAFLAELYLFAGENPIDEDAGIDYFSVFNNQAFLNVEANEVISKYETQFDTIELGDISYDDDKIYANIYIKYKSGESETIEWEAKV